MDQKQKKKHPVKGRKLGAAGYLLLLFVMMAGLCGCGRTPADSSEKPAEAAVQAVVQAAGQPVFPDIPGLAVSKTITPEYAEGFTLARYDDGYTGIRVTDGPFYLVVPGDSAVPEKLPEDTVVLKKPLSRVYMAASSVMALYRALDAVDEVDFSATMADSWYVEEAKEAMPSGDMLFAGKYSAPDYEMLVSRGCSLAVESTMVYHHPEVKEKLESLGIPVFVDQSSYEKNPLGRAEWIKVYGVLTGKEAEAEAFFDRQVQLVQEMQDSEGGESAEDSKTAGDDTASGREGRTSAFFYINSSGQAVVRTGDDYIAEMIRMAGGEYVLSDLRNPNPDSRSGSLTLSMEEFYAGAKDADYLIYNTNIDSSVSSLSDILAKNSLLGEFRAVKKGQVYLTDRYFYQATDILGEMIVDLHRMFAGENGTNMTFLRHLE